MITPLLPASAASSCSRPLTCVIKPDTRSGGQSQTARVTPEGTISLPAIALAAIAGAPADAPEPVPGTVAVEGTAFRQKLARRMGADAVIDIRNRNAPERLRELAPGGIDAALLEELETRLLEADTRQAA